MGNSRDGPSKKIGDGHLAAMARLGLAELRAAAAFPESNIVQPSVPGLYGVPTQGEVAAAREPDAEAASKAQELNEEPRSILNERLERAERACDGRERETRELDRE